MTITIQRLLNTKTKLGISRSTVYLQVSQGLLPKPVQIGLRAVGWPSNEIDAILNARIAGKSQSDIKGLVIELVNQRTNKVGA